MASIGIYKYGRVTAEYIYKVSDNEADFLAALISQLEFARSKFPGKNLTGIALMEEVGELAKAMMDEPVEAVFTEAVQVATMAMRCYLDGDHSVEYRREQNKLEPLGSR